MSHFRDKCQNDKRRDRGTDNGDSIEPSVGRGSNNKTKNT